MGEVQSPWIKSEILLGLYNGSITCLHDLILKLFQPMRKTLPSLKLEGLISIAPEDCVPFDWKLDSPGITILEAGIVVDLLGQSHLPTGRQLL